MEMDSLDVSHQLVDLRERGVLDVQSVCGDPVQSRVIQHHLSERVRRECCYIRVIHSYVHVGNFCQQFVLLAVLERLCTNARPCANKWRRVEILPRRHAVLPWVKTSSASLAPAPI